MRLNSMLTGLCAWTLGIVVPAAYTICMTRIAMAHDTSHWYSAADLMGNFNSMPLMMWLYMIAMGLVGLLLVCYGFTRRRLEEELSV